MNKRLESLAILGAVAFGWTKLGLGAATKEIFNQVIPIGTTVQYIPLGKVNWRDAKTGIVTGTLEATTTGVVSHYQIDDAFHILKAYVRRV